MQLNQSTGYAIRMLVYLAENGGKTRSSTEVSAAIQVASQAYLMRIGAKLRRAGILEAYPGHMGGYSLSRPADEIRLYDVILLMEGTVQLHCCMEPDQSCPQKAAGSCHTLRCFEGMQKYWEKFLKNITIADLVDGLSEEEVARRITGKGAEENERMEAEGNG